MNNNRFFRFFICVFCLFVIVSCSKFTTIVLRSYVAHFASFNMFYLDITDQGNIVMYWHNAREVVSYHSSGEAKKRYDELCQKFDDLAFNQEIRYVGGFSCHRYPSNEILSINVVSNTDFNSEYPAGSSLAGLVRFLSVSPIRFIQSGYRETFNWNNVCEEIRKLLLEESRIFLCNPENHFPIKGRLADLTQEDFLLLGTGEDSGWRPDHAYAFTPGYFFGYLTFEQQPEISGVHEITVTIRLGDGRVLSRTIEKEF